MKISTGNLNDLKKIVLSSATSRIVLMIFPVNFTQYSKSGQIICPDEDELVIQRSAQLHLRFDWKEIRYAPGKHLPAISVV